MLKKRFFKKIQDDSTLEQTNVLIHPSQYLTAKDFICLGGI
jgi:hypothetical protein